VNLRACYHARNVLGGCSITDGTLVTTGFPLRNPAVPYLSDTRKMITVLSYQGDLGNQLSKGTTNLVARCPGWSQVTCEGLPSIYNDGFRFFHRINNSFKLDLQLRAFHDPQFGATTEKEVLAQWLKMPKIFRVLICVARHQPVVPPTAECNDLMNILLPFSRADRDQLINSDMEWAEYVKTRPKHLIHWQIVTFDFSDFEQHMGRGTMTELASARTKTINVSIPWVKLWPYCVALQPAPFAQVPTLKKAREDYLSDGGNTPAILSRTAATASVFQSPIGVGVLAIGNNPHEWTKLAASGPAVIGPEQGFQMSMDVSMCSFSRMSLVKDLSAWNGPRWETGTLSAEAGIDVDSYAYGGGVGDV
jgi:hypothetical protein